jgi:hypothetical protein
VHHRGQDRKRVRVAPAPRLQEAREISVVAHPCGVYFTRLRPPVALPAALFRPCR